MGLSPLIKHDFPSSSLSPNQESAFTLLTAAYGHVCDTFDPSWPRGEMRANIDARAILLTARDEVCRDLGTRQYGGDLIEGLCTSVDSKLSPNVIRITEVPGPKLELRQEPRRFYSVEALGYETTCGRGGCEEVTSLGASLDQAEAVEPICSAHAHLALAAWMGRQ